MCSIYTLAENVEHENILHLSYGGAWLQDQYLSPLAYKGMMVGIGNEWWQPFRNQEVKKNTDQSYWGHLGRIDTKFDWIQTTTKSNHIYAIQIRTGWGAYYLWNFPIPSLYVMLGPYLDVDYNGKLIGSSVNKPYSMDAAIDIMAMAGIGYSFQSKKTSYRLRYLIRTNLIGIDYMPDYWHSYYEMSKGILGKVRCSGMWNHRTIRHQLSLDLQFPHSTWTVGIGHEYLEYGIKYMMFSHEQVYMNIGTIFRYKLKPNHNLTNL